MTAKRRYGVWRLLRWALIVFILGVLGFVIYGWMNRYALLENTLSDILKERGFETAFQIASIDRTQAIIKNVSAASKNSDGDYETFLKAKSLTLNYQWREALNGNVDGVILEQPEFFVEIDTNGDLISPILPESPTPDVPLVLPKNGVQANDARLTLKNAGGILEISGDIDFLTFNKFKADLDLQSGDFAFQNFAADLSGPVQISRENDALSIETDVFASQSTFKDLKLSAVQLASKLDVQTDSLSILATGPLKVSFKDLKLPDYHLSDAVLGWSGTTQITRATPDAKWSVSTLGGEWQATVEDARISSDTRRLAFADLLSLNTVLSKTPMVKNFSAPPNLMAKRILNSAKLKGAGTLDVSSEGYILGLNQPFVAKGVKDTVILSPAATTPALRFLAQEARLKAAMDIKIEGPVALELPRFSLEALSSDGLRLDGVATVASGLRLPQSWTGVTEAGRPAVLRPLQADIRYVATDAERRFNLTGPIAYDGDVPGGYVEGLKANGVTQVIATQTRVETQFVPKAGTEIEIAAFDNPTAWRGEALTFKIAPSGALYILKNSAGRLTTDLSEVSGNWVDTDLGRHIDLNVASVSVTGTLAEDLQNWRLNAMDAKVVSPDVPATGSETFAPEAALVVRLRPDTAPEFSLETKQTNVITETVTATNMTLFVKGTPERFTVDYSDGRAKFATDDLPDLPFSGSVVFDVGVESINSAGGKWTGNARTFLPKAEQTAIDVDYTYENGVGLADVRIEDLVFKPGRLQPQNLVSALRGKISQVSGAVSARINLRFTPDAPLQSSGNVSVKNMSLGTLTGPFAGINTELTFNSMFPLESQGRQKMTAQLFDPGFPLENGSFEFEIIPDGIRLYSANWPLGGGMISVDPTDWIYNAPKNQVTMRLSDISMQSLTDSLGKKNFQVTGIVEGVMPVVIEGVQTNVVDGYLRVKNGGIIRFETPQTEAAAAKNEIAEMAFTALKEFEYKKLEARLDGPLDGNMIVQLEFDGKNDEVLGGAVFAWDVTVEGELVNIARSFSPENMNATYKRVAQEAAKDRAAAIAKETP